MGLVRSEIPEQSPIKIKITTQRIKTYKKKFLLFSLQSSSVLKETEFLSGMAFSIYKVVQFALLVSRVVGLFTPQEKALSDMK